MSDTTTARARDERALDRLDGLAAVVVAIVVVAGGLARMVPGTIGTFHDDAVYAVTAEALAEGKGYHLLNLPGAPAQTKYPILYPAVLALAWSGGSTLETRIHALQLLTLAWAAVALAGAYLLCVRFSIATRGAALAGTLLAASAPNVLFYCSQPLSELPFAGLMVAALWMGESRLRARDSTAGVDFVAGVVLGLPFLCRSTGVVVPLVIIALLAWSRRPILWISVGALAVMSPWVAWVAAVHQAAPDAIIAYQTDYTGWLLSNMSSDVPLANLLKAFKAYPEIQFEPLARWLYANVDSARGLLVVAGGAVWLTAASRIRKGTALPMVLLAYFAFVCLWPWPPDRFLVPILPFLSVLLFEQVGRLAARLTEAAWPKYAFAAVATVMVGANVELLSRYAAVSRSTRYPYFMLPQTPVEWASYEHAFAWLREHTEPDEVLAAGFDSMTALYTSRATIRPFVVDPLSLYYDHSGPPLGSASELRDALDRHSVRYLFVSPQPSYDEEDAFYELVEAATRGQESRLDLVYRGDDPRFLIFEAGRPPAGEAASGGSRARNDER